MENCTLVFLPTSLLQAIIRTSRSPDLSHIHGLPSVWSRMSSVSTVLTSLLSRTSTLQTQFLCCIGVPTLCFIFCKYMATFHRCRAISPYQL